MANILGTEVSGLPDLNITGIFSNTWIYVALIGFIGLILITVVAFILYYRTFNRICEFYENVSGLGYQRIGVKRARRLRVGTSGEELLSVMGGDTLSAYGRKVGRNRYMFCKGIDGYWYNTLHGDLDTKMAMLDIVPVDTDVKMFHVIKSRMNESQYLKKSFMEKYGSTLIMFLFLIILIVGMWVIIGKIGKATESLSATQEANAEVLKTTKEILVNNERLKTGGVSGTVSGLVPAG